jgi:hypothetical protein
MKDGTGLLGVIVDIDSIFLFTFYLISVGGMNIG